MRFKEVTKNEIRTGGMYIDKEFLLYDLEVEGENVKYRFYRSFIPIKENLYEVIENAKKKGSPGTCGLSWLARQKIEEVILSKFYLDI